MSDAPETAQSFNAKGPTITSFETIDEGPRAFGVKVHSNDVCGVYGESMEFPPAVGVRESAVPPRGVFGRGDGIGVEGPGESVGVRGDTTGSPDTSGIGVLGHSGANRAGVFYGNTDDPDKDFLDTLNHSEKHPGKPA